MTLAQAKTLLSVVLEPERITLREVIRIIKYQQARNYAASRSHSKRRQLMKVKRLNC
jgi:hypothetical protein